MHRIATMCRALGVSPGGFYARLRRPPSARARADGELSARIAEIHRRSRATYGAPRIHAELKEQGIRVGCKRVARLMRAAELKGVSRRNWIITTVRDRAARPAPDLVERNFSAPAPNRLWVADITYIPTWAGFLYLAVVLDAFSRKIVGWAMETYLRTELVLKALDMALGQRRAAGVIHHSDQGSQGGFKRSSQHDVVAHRRYWSKASAGVFHPRAFRGLELRVIATAAMSLALCAVRSVPLGKYWRSRPLVFSFVPRCHGLRGSQK
jgi:transposase InsO family protein